MTHRVARTDAARSGRRATVALLASLVGLLVVAFAWAGLGLRSGESEAGASNGDIAFVRSRGRAADLVVVDPATRRLEVVGPGGGTASTPAWSPDGRLLAYAWRDPARGGYQLRILERATGRHRALTPQDAIDGSPSWSPDGRRIAFSTNRDARTFAIHVIRSDGTGAARITDGLSPAWSPDGGSIAFTRLLEGTHRLFLVRADGSDVRRVGRDEADSIDPAWSPDGRTIAFARAEHGRYALFSLDVADGSIRRLTDGAADDRGPAFSPDGRVIVFSRWDRGGATLWTIDQAGRERPLTEGKLFDVDPSWQRGEP